MLFLLWPLPITVFFLLFVYSKGYFLICISGILLIPVFLLKYKLIKRYVIVLIIIFQTAFFLFMPYSDADLYVNMAPDKRKKGKIEAWMGRLSNVFMLSQDAIRKREKHGDEISNVLMFSRKRIIWKILYYSLIPPFL
jgi:energy-coupling factor transporter transmembrane protein EcfT